MALSRRLSLLLSPRPPSHRSAAAYAAAAPPATPSLRRCPGPAPRPLLRPLLRHSSTRRRAAAPLPSPRSLDRSAATLPRCCLWPAPHPLLCPLLLHEAPLPPTGRAPPPPTAQHRRLRSRPPTTSRKSKEYHSGPSTTWDVGGDSFELFDGGADFLQQAEPSLDEPDLERLLEDSVHWTNKGMMSLHPL